jgi:PAS domain S-box-containing protein
LSPRSRRYLPTASPHYSRRPGVDRRRQPEVLSGQQTSQPDTGVCTRSGLSTDILGSARVLYRHCMQRVPGTAGEHPEETDGSTKLAATRRQYRPLYDSHENGFCLCEIITDDTGCPVDYRFLDANPMFEHMSGLVDAVGRTALELVPDLEPVWVASYGRVALDGEILLFEQGSEAMGRFFEVFAMPLDPPGHFGIVFKDISAQHNLENRLRLSEERFRTMADQFPMPVWVTDPKAHMEWVNTTFCQYFGLDRHEVTDDAWLALIHPDQQEAAKAALVGAVLDRTDLHNVVRIRRADGEWRWLESWAKPRLDADRTYAGHVGTSADVTDRVESQLALQRAFESERRARRQVEFLARNATNLAASTTVNALASTVLLDLQGALGVELAALNLVDPEGGLRIISAPGLQPVATYANLGIEANLPGPMVIRTNRSLVVSGSEEITAQFPLLDEAVARHPVGSIGAFPLRSADRQAVGALVLGHAAADWFDEATLNLLATVAENTGLALERAMLYEEVVSSREQQLKISHRLQTALLPDRIMEHPSVAIKATYRAASDLLEVGGDWYDTFSWSDGRVGIVVGDVVGHDLDAVVAMGRLRLAMAALAPLIHEPSAAALLQSLDHCARQAAGTDFVTAACVVVDPATGVLSYATAGHPPPLIVGPDGSTRWLDQASSPPCGGIVVDTRAQATVTLEVGSVVVIYSDGLIERPVEVITEGLDRLRRAAVTICSGDDGTDLERAMERLIVQMTRDSSQFDDLIAVCLRWDPTRFQRRIAADYSALAGLRDELSSWLRLHQIEGQSHNDILLALNEATSNAVRHAYPDRSGTVKVELTLAGRQLLAVVSDTGTWRPPTPNSTDGGYGTRIMQRLATRFDRVAGTDGTTVMLTLPT